MSFFDDGVTSYLYEWCVGMAVNGFVSDVYTDYDPSGVDLTEELMEAGLFDGLKIVIHNHLKGQAPFASHYDIAAFIENRVEYGVVTNDFGVFIIKNKNIDKNYKNSTQIKECIGNLEERMEKEFLTNNKYAKKWRESNEDKYYQELNNHIKNNYMHYLDEYKTLLGDDFEVVFIDA